MADVTVVKKAKEEAAAEPFRFPVFPMFRGNFFNMNPFGAMKHFVDEMDKAFSHFGGDGAWSPAIEIKEKDGKLTLTADIPGVKKEDVNVHIDEDLLVVEGERKFEKEEKKEGYFHSERRYGKFYRAVQLPAGAKVDETAANFTNGVLEVTVPIPEVKPKRQDVPVGEGVKPAEAGKKAA